MQTLLHTASVIFIALTLAAILTRIAYAVTERIAEAPLLDLFVLSLIHI